MSGYENAPATIMLATHCAICARPLVDSVSVEIGMGPDCRRKHGYEITGIANEARESANKIINAIACGDDGRFGTDLAALVRTLRFLGFVKLADVLIKRKAAVRLVEDVLTGVIEIYSRYNESFLNEIRGINGRRWNKEGKFWTVPTSEKNALWTAMKRTYPNQLGYGCKGEFMIAA